MSKRLLALTLALALAGCQTLKAGPATPLPSAPVRPVAAGIVHEGGVVFAQSGIRGRLRAPANVMVPGGRIFRVLAATERPLAGVEVLLTDTAGKAVVGVASVQTDANGAFAFERVPAGRTYVVVARVTTAAGKSASLRSLARPTGTGTTIEVSAASSLVTARALAVPKPEQVDFNPASYEKAVDAANQALSDAALPDWSDAHAVDQATEALAQGDPAVQTALGAIKQDASEFEALDADLRAALARAGGPATDGTSPCEPLVRAYDADHDGSLGLEELRKLLADAQQDTPETNRTRAEAFFALVDRQGNGAIDAGDLATFLDLDLPEPPPSSSPKAPGAVASPAPSSEAAEPSPEASTEASPSAAPSPEAAATSPVAPESETSGG